MSFDWSAFGANFLYNVLVDTDKSPEMLEKYNYYYSKMKDVGMLHAFMQEKYNAPDINFVEKHRHNIEKHFLRYHKPIVSNLCKSLVIMSGEFQHTLRELERLKTTTSLCETYLAAMYRFVSETARLNEYCKFRSTVKVDVKNTETQPVNLYRFQNDAYCNLKKYFLDENGDKGFLVMPTGAGKTRTTTKFLIQEMIPRGYQVLWIAHRHMLLDQAADCFYKFAGLAKINKPDIRDYRISCVSGEHMKISQVGSNEVIIASIQSLHKNKPHLKRILNSPKVVVVIDEAHHASAAGYRNIIEFIQGNVQDVKLLGVTATPIRGNDRETPKLHKIFGQNIIYSIPMATLIDKHILAQPEFERIETDQEFESQITPDEEILLNRYKELPETVIGKIARSKVRNNLIVQQYINNVDKYGKTLIFAMNQIHCITLYDELKARNVSCGMVYSGQEDNTSVIDSFKEGRIKVLINVNIMTEGSDVPDIQTIFLTRPTSSRGFLMQMIGRGMRGVAAEGTETVNIVDFVDTWDKFREWLNPKWCLLDESDEDSEERRYIRGELIKIEWSKIRSAYNYIKASNAIVNTHLSIPVGWYVLEDEESDEYHMLVFQDQLPGYKAMLADRNIWRQVPDTSAKDMYSRYFNNFCLQPSERDLTLLIDFIQNNDELPHLHLLKQREAYDPYYVARRVADNKLDIFAESEKIYNENETARNLFPTLEEYQMELCKMRIYLDKKHVMGYKVEELPIERIPFDRNPYHNLQNLYMEVISEMFGGKYPGIGTVQWTDKAYKDYFGRYYHDTNDIRINKVLDSKDVPKEVVKFIIYHELLHRDIHGHGPAFKEQEHKYPNYAKWENFLDEKMEDLEIEEWH